MDVELQQAELIIQLREMKIGGERQAASSDQSNCYNSQQGSDSGFNSDKVRNEREGCYLSVIFRTR